MFTFTPPSPKVKFRWVNLHPWSQSPLKVGISKFYYTCIDCMFVEQESEEELESEEDSDDDVNIMIGDIDGQAVININPVSSLLKTSLNLYFRKIRQMTVKRRRRLSLHQQL